MKKIKWTRRNKLFMGLGGLGVVLVAVFLVFTFVGMPGGGKLFGFLSYALYEITLADLDGRTLPDGDRVQLEEIRPLELTDIAEGDRSGGTDGMVGFELVLQEGMWWKGVVIVTSLNPEFQRTREIVAGDHKGSPYTGILAIKDLGQLDHVVLSKAKFLGIHTGVYKITDARNLKGGKMYRITWLGSVGGLPD